MKWHDDDDFWFTYSPFMFDEQRLAATPAEVDKLLALLKFESGAKLLDLGCGPGRHSIELARRGYQVTGVDRTNQFLEMARDVAKAEQLEVDFELADMRTYKAADTFDGALSLFTSFGYFEDQVENLKVLSNVYQSLKKEGTFILELMGKEVLARVFRER